MSQAAFLNDLGPYRFRLVDYCARNNSMHPELRLQERNNDTPSKDPAWTEVVWFCSCTPSRLWTSTGSSGSSQPMPGLVALDPHSGGDRGSTSSFATRISATSPWGDSETPRSATDRISGASTQPAATPLVGGLEPQNPTRASDIRKSSQATWLTRGQEAAAPR